jgi:hypothetical protein
MKNARRFLGTLVAALAFALPAAISNPAYAAPPNPQAASSVTAYVLYYRVEGDENWYEYDVYKDLTKAQQNARRLEKEEHCETSIKKRHK